MKKLILLFTIVLFLFSVSMWANMQKATDQFGKTASTQPKIVKSAARPTFPQGVTPKRRSRALAAPINENQQPASRISRDGVATVWEENFETDADLFYYDDVAYIWYAPDEFTQYAVRYTPLHGGSLDGAYFYFYGGDATAADFHVWADDGSGYPGASLGSLTAVPVTLGAWFYADLSSLAISVSGTADIFISFEVNGTGSIQLISSSGADASGVNRSLVWTGTAWEYAIDNAYCGYDYEWAIDAMITYNDPWTSALGKWQLQTNTRTDSAYSAVNCWHVDEELGGGFKDFLTSPVFTLDADQSYDLYNLSLWVDIEFMRSSAGGTSIDEYYEVYIADVDATPTDWWHVDAFNGYDNNSWWCGTDSLPGWVGGWGYGNSWNQWVQTPDFTLPMTTGINLDFWNRHDSEPGYDFCYVEVSADNWNSFDQLAAYDGAANTWTAVNIGLDAYAGQTVSVRFRFESDTGYSDEDGLYLSEGGWFIDDVVISDTTNTVYFEDNADDQVNFIVNQGNFDWVQLFYDYDRDYPAPSNGWELTDANSIFNGTCNITDYAGKNVQIMVSAAVDDSTYTPSGAGLSIDDIAIDGIALPEFDIQTDFLVVPYPQTEEAPARSITTPKIIYHQAGFSTSTPNAACDVVGLGNSYPDNDYFGLSLPGVAMGEYALGELQYQAPTGFSGLVAGTYDYMGWCDGSAVRGDTFTDSISVKVYPPGEYELGYNSREIGNYYYPGCTGAAVLYTPFSDGIFTARDTYEIDGVSHMIYSRGQDFDGDCLTFTVYDYNPATPDQFGTQLYTEDICFNIDPSERFTWIEIPFSTPVTVSNDYWILVTGDFVNYPGGAPNEPGYFVYSMLVDSEVLFEDDLPDGQIYAGHSFNYDPTARYTLTEYPSNFYINSLINTEVPSTLNEPQNVTVTEAAGVVTVSWDAVRFATSYNVYSDTDPYGAFSTLETPFGTALLTWDDTSASGAKKFYIVKAVK